MLKAQETAIALVAVEDDEWFVAGHESDIQRLADGGFVERAWSISLDNGHRPYATLKRRLNYDINEASQDLKYNVLTTMLAKRTGLAFSHNLHVLEHTYLARKSSKFWTEVEVVFADEDGRLREIIPSEYYALFNGKQSGAGNVRFVRLEPGTLV